MSSSSDSFNFGVVHRSDRAHLRDYGREVRGGRTKFDAERSIAFYNSDSSRMMRKIMRDMMKSTIPGIIAHLIRPTFVGVSTGVGRPLKFIMPKDWKVNP